MRYDEALQLWGASKLAAYNRIGVDAFDLATVRVDFEFNEGYACCGGADPNCYCSFAESPSADVRFSGALKSGRRLGASMSAVDFDFAEVLREICELGGDITT